MATWLAALLIAACSAGDPPEARLRASVDALHAAVEAREGSAIGDFIGPQAMDREGALRMARLAFLRYRAVGVTIVGPMDVRMQGDDHARVRFEAALTGGSGALLPESARVWSVDTGWRAEDGEWRMTSATWEPRL
jgi:hypothetical protein